MLPAAGGLPSVILGLTVAFVASGLVLLIVLAPSGRGRAARLVVVAGMVALVLAIVVTMRRSASERAQSWSTPVPHAPMAVVVPEPPALPPVALAPDGDEESDDVPAPPDEESVTIAGEIPDMPEIATEWLNASGASVRIEGSKLVIGGHAAVPLRAPTRSKHGEVTERERRAMEVEVRATVRRDAAERLSEYFDELVHEPPPAIPRLSELRSTLKRLTTVQRAKVAEQAARLRTVVTRHDTAATGTSEADAVEFYAPDVEISPDQIRDLIRVEIARGQRGGEVSTPAKVLGTLGVLVGAVAALKISTRRNCGINPGR
jgi:hypothetical protein